MNGQRILAAIVGAIVLGAASMGAVAQPASAPDAAPPPPPPLFAVEIRIGEKWDAGKPPHEQAHFKEHSSNLRRLRERGVLQVGLRYADTGFIVLSAPTEADARALLDEDPSFAARIFRYSISPLNVFYGGTLPATPRR